MGRRTPGREILRENIPILKCIFTKNVMFGLQTAFFNGFNVLLSFLAEKSYRTNMKLPQKVCFELEM